MPMKRTFYVPEEYQPLIDKLMRILRREGKSLSRWILENAVEYVSLHEPGNPQLLMNRFIKPPEPVQPAEAPSPKPPEPKGPCSSCRWLDARSHAPRGYCKRRDVFIAPWALQQGFGCHEWGGR